MPRPASPSDAVIGDALLSIMNDILDFSRIESEELVLELTQLRDAWSDVLAGVPRQAKPEPPALRVTGAPLRILVVEDNLVNQRMAQLLLRKLGHQVDAVSDGLAAVQAVDEQRYDVVIMDVSMPTMDGLEATRRIRSHPGKDQPHIVALTASTLVEDRAACAQAGMEDYLTKPVRARDLQAMLDRTTGQAVGAMGRS